MDLTLLPSLQHLAVVRVALNIYNDDFIHFFRELVKLDDYDVLSQSSLFDFDRMQERWINQRQNKPRRYVYRHLPKVFQKRVLQIFQPLINEIRYWFRDHYHIIKRIDETQFMNCLCWKSEGTIDRTKTAERLIRNESIDKRVRFIVACVYFLKNDVQNLWQRMNIDERGKILRIDSNKAVHFWIEWLEKNAKYCCFIKFFREFTPNLLNRYSNRITCSRLRLSSFFSELGTMDKSLLLHDFWPQGSHADDLRQCYNVLQDEERAGLFHGCLLMRDVLTRFLDWPLQTVFLEAVDQMKSHLVPDSYEYLLRHIVAKKLMEGMQDFNYLELIKDLWSQTPDSYQVEIQRERTFIFVRAAINCDVNAHPLRVQELLQKCRLLTDTVADRFRDDPSSWMNFD